MKINLYKTSDATMLNGISENHKRIFLKNPFVYEGAPFQLRAEEDGKIHGSVYAFPMQLCYKNEEIYTVCAGSTLYVSPESRCLGLAKKMTLRRLEITEDKIAIASGLSGMSLPLFKKLDFSVFMSKRNIFLQNSRTVVEMVFKGGLLLKAFTAIANIFVNFQSAILKNECNLAFRRLSIEEVTEVPNEVPEIVAHDPALFRENHTKEWFEWVLKGGFNEDTRSKQHLFVVKKGVEIVAFFMTKERFHEQASNRGFKNVILGSVIEWGVKQGVDLKEVKLILAALLSFGNHVDAVEICSAYEHINNYLKRRFLVPVGESNFAVKAMEESPMAIHSEYHKQSNWRIRPAASDNSFN